MCIRDRPVFRRGIQRGVEDRIGRPAVGFEVRAETLHAGYAIISPLFWGLVNKISPDLSLLALYHAVISIVISFLLLKRYLLSYVL